MSRVHKIEARLAVTASKEKNRTHGNRTHAEYHAMKVRLQVLRAVSRRSTTGQMSIWRGGRRPARIRHNFDAAGTTPAQWRERYLPSACSSERMARRTRRGATRRFIGTKTRTGSS